MSRDCCFVGRLKQTGGVIVLLDFHGIFSRKLLGRNALFLGALDDLVIHVGIVPNIGDVIARAHKDAEKQIRR